MDDDKRERQIHTRDIVKLSEVKAYVQRTKCNLCGSNDLSLYKNQSTAEMVIYLHWCHKCGDITGGAGIALQKSK